MRPYWLFALAAAACSLSSSLDDLRGGADSDGGSGVGGKDGGAGTGSAGGADGSATGGADGRATGGTDGSATGGTGGTNPWPDAADPCATAAKCTECCSTSHVEGQQQFNKTIAICVCGDPNCAQACSEFCGGGQISTECSACVSSQSVQACIGSTCSSAACSGYTSCVAGC